MYHYLTGKQMAHSNCVLEKNLGKRLLTKKWAVFTEVLGIQQTASGPEKTEDGAISRTQ